MITYKYSLIKDLKIFLHNRKVRKQLEENGVVFIEFNFLEYIKLLLNFWRGKLDLPELKIEENIIFYIVSSGTWGAYELPNKVFICPRKIENLETSLSELILHEIVHLRLEEKIKGNNFEERERLVNEEVQKIVNK